MMVDKYTLDDFLRRTENLHGYAAPGVLAGGYLVARAKRLLPPDSLFEVVCETSKCLPDAVQLLTVCSIGSGRLWIRDSGRYAVTLFDKYTLEGIRSSIDLEQLEKFPEYEAWFLKKKPKKEQDSELLMSQIAQAGESVCAVRRVTVDKSSLARIAMGPVKVCPLCQEAFPGKDGNICSDCRRETAYLKTSAMERLGTAEPQPGRDAEKSSPRLRSIAPVGALAPVASDNGKLALLVSGRQ